MDDPKTVVTPERKFEPWRELSSRLSRVEASQIKQGDRMIQLQEQLLQAQIKNSRLTHDVANNAVEKLDLQIEEMERKRDDLIGRLAACEDDRERFLLEMSLDNMEYRVERARLERDQALMRKDSSGQVLTDTQQKLKTMKPGDMTLAFPALQPAPPVPSVWDKMAKWFADKVLGPLVLLVIYLILDALKEYVIGRLVP